MGDDDDVAVAAVTAAELLAGVELGDARTRARRQRFVEDLFGTVSIEIYDLTIARAHARLLAYVRQASRPRGARDLVIAATAVARDRIVVSDDIRAFDGLPGVTLRATSSQDLL